MFRALEAGETEYKIISRKTEETVGFMVLRNKRWYFDPLLVQLTAPELMDLSALMCTLRNDYLDNDETSIYEDNS